MAELTQNGSKRPSVPRKVKLPRLDALALDQVISFSSHKYWGVTDPARFAQLME